jgi:hypothetical protein
MRASTGKVTIREADTIWREEGGWFDARWHLYPPDQAYSARRAGRRPAMIEVHDLRCH